MQNATIKATLTMLGAHLRPYNNECEFNAIAAEIATVARLTNFPPPGVSWPTDIPFQCEGDVNLTRARVRGLVDLSGAIIGAKERRRYFQLIAQIADIDALYANKCSLGSINLMDSNFTSGVQAPLLSVFRGVINFSGCKAGRIDLSDCDFINPIAGSDLMEFDGARVANLLTVGMSLSIENYIGALPVRRSIYPQFGDDYHQLSLANLSVGGVSDNNGRGWGDGVILKTEGFIYSRMPHRPIHLGAADKEKTPRHGWTGKLLDAIPEKYNGAFKAASDPRTGEPTSAWIKELPLGWRIYRAILIGPYRYFHAADNHKDWLNRQYENPKRPILKEFTPSAYDQLSKVLREEGHDNEAKRVLSAKFSVKRKVDVPFPAAPFWFLYHRLFDYGLSALYAFATFLLCLLLGTYGVKQALHSQVPGKDMKGNPISTSVLVVTTGAVNTVAYDGDEGAASNQTSDVGVAKASGKPDPEVPCRPDRIDAFLYAAELFVPALDLGQKKLCEVSAVPAAWPWRWSRALYAILGWIVTSITVLTVPGILRSRAEG